MNLEGIIRNIDRVIPLVGDFVAEAHKDAEREIVGLQKEQISKGIRGDGERTKKYASDSYIKTKNKKSAPSFPNRNYFDTGEFYSEMFLEVNGSNIYLGSYDAKSHKIETEENNQLFGITKKNNPKREGLIKNNAIKKINYELSR